MTARIKSLCARPKLKRGDMVRCESKLYRRGLSNPDERDLYGRFVHELVAEKGDIGFVRDFRGHPWVGVHGVFIATVEFNGKLVQVNERALTRMKPGPSKYHPYEPA